MAANRKSPGSRRPQFFKIFLPSSSQQLRIPPKFVPQLAGEGGRIGRTAAAAAATILSPLGKFWHVEVRREGGEAASFGRGWPEFAAAHGLAPGDLLLFSYQGNMVFTLKVFDRTGCLRLDYTGNSGVVAVPAAPVVDRHPHHRYPLRGAARAGPTPSTREGPSLGFKDPIGERRKRVSEPNLSNVKREEKEEEEIIPKRKEKPRNQKASKNNCYEKMIRPYNIKNYMTISKPFCTSHGLLALREVVIKDSRRRSWVVSFGTGSTYCYLGKGWRDFSEANKVKEGDTCIFKVAGKNVLHVSVVRR